MGLYIGKVDRRWLSRVLLIMLADIIGIMGSYLLALWARFDFHFTDIPQEFVDGYLHTIWWWVPVCLAVFWLCNLYNSIWRFVSVDALMRIILAYVLLGGLSFACVALFGVHMPGPIMCGACSSASSAPPASAFSIAGCGTCATGRLWPGKMRKTS